MKKKIVLAGMWKRIASHGIDLGCTLVFSAILYFGFVMNIALDLDAFKAHTNAANEAQLESGLYLDFGKGLTASPYYLSEANSLDGLSSLDIAYEGNITHAHILDSLYEYYTVIREGFNEDKPNLSLENFESTVLNVGKESSNIASFSPPSESHHASVEVIDANLIRKTLSFVKSAYEGACDEVNLAPRIKVHTDANNSAQLFLVLMLIPTVGGTAFVFTGILPLFMPYGKTLGKLATHLVVLNGAGYEIKKWQLLVRSLAYVVLELIGGVLSFGALFLISYTITMFTKKHRSFHDYIGYTVVADERNSFWFKDRYDEMEWNETHVEEEKEEC